MTLKQAIKGQYHAGLEQLRQCVDRCPEGVWVGGEHPRSYWRIAYHAAFYTHLYMQQYFEAFQQWDKARDTCKDLWGDPAVLEPYLRSEIMEYIDQVDSGVDATVEALDLDSADTGFPWYKDMAKLDHVLMNLRHLQGHVGQLSERLMAHGVDIDWVGKRARAAV
ncbi:MAG TPA: DinB family protein [Chthonomonadaceae bacterium]|nr:DinB family protein [Chthonomonadaceae bacterium]